ncbi:L-type lectin-domain containing receptor kinase IV.2 [Zea mays]|uniref:non-specific serine/threonine protein kinase n=1 Tax=Zea mays TaxID=4577 RepID=A0A3L6DA47_MAIZE|nr:L-type lectin-domain containing receptor kinase IV.2 [Zea mays]
MEEKGTDMVSNQNITLFILLAGLSIAEFSAGDDDQFVYTGFTSSNLTLDGGATVTPSGLLELTNGTVRQKGHGFHPSSVLFYESSSGAVQSFSVSFVFAILSTYPETESGHGLAFFIAPDKNLSGSFPTQYLGLFSDQTNGDPNSHIFAVELDTVQNYDLQDINNNHVGINVNSLRSIRSHDAGYYDDKSGLFKDLSLDSHEAMQVWVNYNRETTQINVTIAPLNVAKPMRPLLSANYNLSAVITNPAYIGFSSSTGSVSGQHYLLGWSFGINSPAPPIDITKLPEMPRLGQKARSKALQITLPITILALFLAASITIFLFVRRKLRYAELREDWEVEYGPHRFSYKDLFDATRGFRDTNLLGTGGFGMVYKGILRGSRLNIAVKRVSHDSKQGIKEFITEIVSIGHLQHRNLVPLLGYCRRKGELLLVYDYMPNGSLDKYLYGKEGKPTLDWTQRFQIIKGVASGLLYLHEECEKVIIHRDIKASNVLIDNEIHGRIGDFGLARLYDHGTDPEATHVVGTIGYLAPEVARTGRATPLTDVFAFGIFILEVTCGQRPIKQSTQDRQVMLVDWVLEHWHKGSLTDTVDIKIQDVEDNCKPQVAQKILCSCILLELPQVTSMPEKKHKWLILYHLLYLSILNFTSFIIAGDQFVYSSFREANLSLDGTATIKPDGLLELTNGSFNLKGHAFYPTPLHFRKSSGENVKSFSVTFIFSILSAYPDKSADGMTFLVTTNKNFSDAFPAQYLGLLNDQNNGNPNNHIFAVELDTIQNSEFEDINDNHIGININGLHSVQSQGAGFYDDKNGMFKNMSLISREVMQVWVEYDGWTTQIDVTLGPIKMAKPNRPLVSAIYNLSTVLTDTSYIGFSSSTGVINSRYCLLGWSFSMGNTTPEIDITKLPKLPRVGSRSPSKVLTIILPTAIASFIFVTGTTIILLARRKLANNELQEDWEVEFGPHRFTYKDLFLATEGFKNKNVLGAGGFGKVYKGILPTSKLEIAVKRLSHNSKQGTKEFITEIVSIGHLRHRNLVQLLGYCRRKGELLLVYDYMPNGSLDKFLYCENDKPSLDWATRFHIIKGAACGLLYLHEKWDKVVIHRDIKASNVLLDSEFNGRLGDFGLAKSYNHGTDPQTTRVVGTMGYLAPELVRMGKASPLTDVFAFGTFLLEVTCGHRPVKQNELGEHIMLVDWVLDHWQKGSLVETIDKRLEGNCNIDEACLVLKLGLLCSQPFASARPSMHLVIQYLNGDMQLPEFTPSDISINMLAFMENRGFNPSLISYPQLTMSVGTMSSLSGGR